MSVYVASKSSYGPMWQNLRDMGLPIISTWIDESGTGATDDFADLWIRCISEASQAEYLIAYHDGDEVWKGAFIEIGAALATGSKVFVVGNPPGTWMNHPSVSRCATIEDAFVAMEWDAAAVSLTEGDAP